MESKKVKALLAAVKSGSLTAAATELGYTQAGLTQMMNSLESELGINLLIRGKGGVKLSRAGESLLAGMQSYVAAADALERSVALLRDESTAAIRIGSYSSISRQWLPAILSDFLREFPDADTEVSAGSIEQMYDGVKDETLGCAFVSYQPALMKGLNWFPLHVDELMAVLPADHPFSGDASGPFFTGKIIGPAVDTQKIGKDGSFRLSARYMLEGVDSAGNACRVFIENQGNEAEGFCPWLVTDSPVLQQWEGKKLTATIGGTPQGVLVRIREAGEP